VVHDANDVTGGRVQRQEQPGQAVRPGGEGGEPVNRWVPADGGCTGEHSAPQHLGAPPQREGCGDEPVREQECRGRLPRGGEGRGEEGRRRRALGIVASPYDREARDAGEQQRGRHDGVLLGEQTENQGHRRQQQHGAAQGRGPHLKRQLRRQQARDDEELDQSRRQARDPHIVLDSRRVCREHRPGQGRRPKVTREKPHEDREQDHRRGSEGEASRTEVAGLFPELVVDEAHQDHLQWPVIGLRGARRESFEIGVHRLSEGLEHPTGWSEQDPVLDLSLIGPDEVVVQGAEIEPEEDEQRK